MFEFLLVRERQALKKGIHNRMRLKGIRGTVFIIILIILCTSSIKSETTTIPIVLIDQREYISLYTFITVFKVDNSFDIITRRGKLYHKSDVCVYQVGFSVILINGLLEKSQLPIIRRKGEIFFPADLLGSVTAQFYPHLQMRRKNMSYVFTPRKGKSIESLSQKDQVLPKGSRDRIGFIIIDPGHGGKDPGAIGKGRVREKWIVLQVGKYLHQELKKKVKNVRIILTRSSDKFIELGRRTEIANRVLRNNVNGILVSIHANASISSRISGFETYFLSQNPTNEEARTTAALENNVVILEDRWRRKSYDDVDFIEALMITTQIQRESALLAQHIQTGLDKQIWEFKSRGVKKADFFVLRGALMPAVLVEIGYMSNKKELKHLRRSSYQRKISRGIANGIHSFIKKYNEMVKSK